MESDRFNCTSLSCQNVDDRLNRSASRQDQPSGAAIVIVYQIGALGDTVVSIPALRAIRRAVGAETEIVLLHNAERAARVIPADVLSGSGLVDRFIPYDSGGGWFSRGVALLRLWRKFRRLPPGKVFYVGPGNRSRASVRRDRAFFRLCGIRELVGFHFVAEYQPNVNGHNGSKPVAHESLVRLKRLSRDGVESTEAYRTPLLCPPPQAKEAVVEWLAGHRKQPTLPLVAICPGSQMRSKLWPPDRFAEVGRRLLDKYRVEIIVVGGPAERLLGEDLVGLWGAGLNAAGNFGVVETAALFQKCVFTITLDTGPMHLAAAVGTKCIALFSGIESPGKWDPLGDGHSVIRKDVSCACCRTTVCPVEDHPCMNNITVEEVWLQVESFMARIETTHAG